MKIRSILASTAALIACSCLALAPIALTGCGSSASTAGNPTASPTPAGPSAAATYLTPANVQTAATLATSNALAFLKADEQKEVAADTAAAAHALRTLSAGQAPTVEQVQATMSQFGGPTMKPGYKLLTGNLSALYASFYPALIAHGDAAANAKVVAYLEALASGAENGAAPYL